MQDAAEKGRMRRGEKNHNTKITEETAREIKFWLAQGIYRIGELAIIMGVAYSIVANIKYNNTWKWIEV